MWRCGNERQAQFEEVVNLARSHRTLDSGVGIVRLGERRAEDERNEVDVGRVRVWRAVTT